MKISIDSWAQLRQDVGDERARSRGQQRSSVIASRAGGAHYASSTDAKVHTGRGLAFAPANESR